MAAFSKLDGIHRLHPRPACGSQLRLAEPLQSHFELGASGAFALAAFALAFTAAFGFAAALPLGDWPKASPRERAFCEQPHHCTCPHPPGSPADQAGTAELLRRQFGRFEEAPPLMASLQVLDLQQISSELPSVKSTTLHCSRWHPGCSQDRRRQQVIRT
eukprot:g9985.t1